jgi:hypothetical protein
MYLPNEDYIKLYSLEYIEYIRTRPCCVSGDTVVDAHHLEAIGSRGQRYEPNTRHFSAIPICRELHTELHTIGIHKFQEKYNIQLWQEAMYLFAKWLLIKLDKPEEKPLIVEEEEHE